MPMIRGGRHPSEFGVAASTPDLMMSTCMTPQVQMLRIAVLQLQGSKSGNPGDKLFVMTAELRELEVVLKEAGSRLSTTRHSRGPCATIIRAF